MVKLDKIGTIGVWIAALSCPACFPAHISLVSVMGLGIGIALFGLIISVTELVGIGALVLSIGLGILAYGIYNKNKKVNDVS